MNVDDFIQYALQEDIESGDHSTLSCIPATQQGKAILKVKETCIIAGVEIAEKIFKQIEPTSIFNVFKKDGENVNMGDYVFEIKATVHTILKAERLVLNIMQRMSGIATLTHTYVDKIKNYPATILDTRKTTPNFRWFEKKAVTIGGGSNHRFGLYDMIMLKDNHIDYCGGIAKAINQANNYLKANNLNLQIEVETRTINDVEKVLENGGVHRIMLDNFTPSLVAQAVKLINHQYETEASGGITLNNIEEYAKTGVDFISVGAIIHHAVSVDLSLKAQMV